MSDWRLAGICTAALVGAFATTALPGSEPPSSRDQASGPGRPHRLGPTSPNETIEFSLLLLQPRRSQLERYLREVQDPSAPGYRRFVSPAQFGARFGVPAAALARARTTLAAAGLRVTGAYPQRTALRVRGRAADVGRFLGVRFADYADHRTHRYHAPLRAPTVPSSIAGTVAAATGLSSRPRVRPAAIPAGGLKPRDALAAYNLLPLRRRGLLGQGQTIAIVSFDSFHDEDVADYDRQVGIVGAPPVEHVPVDGGSPVGPGQEEVNLDIDVVRGIAPRARILNYETANDGTGFDTLINRIVADGRADIVSISWGKCALRQGAVERRAEEQAMEAAVARGITVFVASGDAGAYGCQREHPDDQRLAVDWPSASPNVIAVGGTTLAVRRDGSYGQEFGWEGVLGHSGGGGGVDRLAPRPPWQRGRGVDNRDSTGRRQVPDVAASADPASGWFVYYGGVPAKIGGTSAAAPFWAASMLLVRQLAQREGAGRLGYVNPILYRLAQRRDSPFHDVTRGGNRYYNAGPGWDYSTGLGSPDVTRLADQMVRFLKRAGVRSR